MSECRDELLSQLGFRFGSSGPHAARTMMLADLQQLLQHTVSQASRAAYAAAVVEDNLLGKPTRKSRQLAWRHLATLYGLDSAYAVFRALRRLWPLNEAAQPLLALAVALARDPLLWETRDFFLDLQIGMPVSTATVQGYLETRFPDRFSSASMRSIAKNLGGTWTAAGLLQGRAHKVRAALAAYPESITLLLFLGFLEGRSGQRLFTSPWVQLLDLAQDRLDALVSAAAHRGLLVYMHAGGVKEVRFPGYLTAQEEHIRQELSHVVPA